jgi:hypothetical protein
MIGPVSETGRTMMASLQQAISKGMPVDQAISYVKSMANDGVAPLVDLYALMKQFERMKQQPTPALQTPNIREQLNMLEASQSQGQRGLPAAMPPQNPQAMMGQGLGGLPAGRMENPQFAGGGIVAFAGEGDSQVTDSSAGAPSITPQLYSPVPKFKTWDEAAAAYRAQIDNPQFLQQEMARREALAQQQQMDEYAPSYKMREKLLAEDTAAAERTAEEEAAYDRDEYWGDVAANAAERGATLLSSLAKAQKGKATRKRATADKARTAIRAAKQAELLLLQAKEAEKEGRYKDAEALRKEAAQNATLAQGKVADTAASEAKARADFNRNVRLRQIEGPIDAKERVLRILATAKPGSPEYEAARDRLNDMNTSGGRLNTEDRQALGLAERRLDAAKKAAVDPITGKPLENAPSVVEAQRALDNLRDSLVAQGKNVPGYPASSTAPTTSGDCTPADVIAGVPGCGG